MIPYEELVAALDRYVARNGGTPMSAQAPASPSYAAPPAAVHHEAPAHEVDLGGYDEPRDPDLPHMGGEEDATHVGAMPGGAQPTAHHGEDPSNESDIGDVLADDELTEPMRPADAIVEVAGAALGLASEISGTVVDAGEAAREWIGRRVVVPRLLPCGDCDRCRRGRVATCSARILNERSALTRTEEVPARWLTSVEPPLWPEGVELWQLAALADAALTPYTALSRAGVGPSDRVVVLGNDARARFAADIVAAKGATLVESDATPDGAIVIATRPPFWARALTRIAPGVTTVLLGGGASDTFVVDPKFVVAEGQLITVFEGHPDLLPELVALVVRGQLPLAPAVRRVGAVDAESARAAYLDAGGLLPIVAA